jgi:hypothetical protein
MRHGAHYTSRAGLAGLAVVTAAALALGACGNPSAPATSPKQAVSKAVGAVSSQKGVNLRISLGVTADQLMTMDKAAGGNDGFTRKIANTIASATIVLDSHHVGSGSRADQFDLALQVGTATPIELRYLNQTLFLHADIKTLGADIGKDTSSVNKALQSANSFVPGISALGGSGWVSAKPAALAPLLNGLKAQAPATATTPAATRDLMTKLDNAFNANATITSAGTHGGRAEYIVALRAHDFVEAAAAALPTSMLGAAGGSTATNAVNGLVNKIPAGQTVVVDLWVRNNTAQEIDIDLNQFASQGHKFGFPVPLRIVIGPSAAVSAPPGATALDLSKIPQLLGGLMSGGLGGLGGSSSSGSGSSSGSSI